MEFQPPGIPTCGFGVDDASCYVAGTLALSGMLLYNQIRPVGGLRRPPPPIQRTGKVTHWRREVAAAEVAVGAMAAAADVAAAAWAWAAAAAVAASAAAAAAVEGGGGSGSGSNDYMASKKVLIYM
jgi:hypothetical protein